MSTEKMGDQHLLLAEVIPAVFYAYHMLGRAPIPDAIELLQDAKEIQPGYPRFSREVKILEAARDFRLAMDVALGETR